MFATMMFSIPLKNEEHTLSCTTGCHVEWKVKEPLYVWLLQSDVDRIMAYKKHEITAEDKWQYIHVKYGQESKHPPFISNSERQLICKSLEILPETTAAM